MKILIILFTILIALPTFSKEIREKSMEAIYQRELQKQQRIINDKLKFKAKFICQKNDRTHSIILQGNQTFDKSKRLSNFKITLVPRNQDQKDIFDDMNLDFNKEKGYYFIDSSSSSLNFNSGSFVWTSKSNTEYDISLEDFRPNSLYPDFNELLKTIVTFTIDGENIPKPLNTFLYCEIKNLFNVKKLRI